MKKKNFTIFFLLMTLFLICGVCVSIFGRRPNSLSEKPIDYPYKTWMSEPFDDSGSPD